MKQNSLSLPQRKQSESMKIFIGCLPAETVEEELCDYFKRFCHLDNFKIKYRSNKICAGYGHFICLNPTQRVLTKLFRTSHYYLERSLEVRKYLTGEALDAYQFQFNKRRVYIRNLPPKVKDQELEVIFEQFGPVERAYQANNPDKDQVYFGFIVFAKQGIIENIIDTSIMIQNYEVQIRKVVRSNNNNSQKDKKFPNNSKNSSSKSKKSSKKNNRSKAPIKLYKKLEYPKKYHPRNIQKQSITPSRNKGKRRRKQPQHNPMLRMAETKV